MSSQFEKEAKEIIGDLPKPDADAKVIKELNVIEDKPKRGRPKGSTNNSAPKKPRTRKDKISKADREAMEDAAKAINACFFAGACAFFGTADAWPEDNEADKIDRALVRYFEIRDINFPPEVLLAGAYLKFMAQTAKKPTVAELIKQRFYGWKKFLNPVKWFKRKPRNDAGVVKTKGLIGRK